MKSCIIITACIGFIFIITGCCKNNKSQKRNHELYSVDVPFSHTNTQVTFDVMLSQLTSKLRNYDKSFKIILSCDKDVLQKKKIPYENNNVNVIADLVWFTYWYDLVLCLDGYNLILLDNTSILPLTKITYSHYKVDEIYKVDGLNCTKEFSLRGAINYLKSNDIDEMVFEYPLKMERVHSRYMVNVASSFNMLIVDVAWSLCIIKQQELRVYFKYNPELNFYNGDEWITFPSGGWEALPST